MSSDALMPKNSSKPIVMGVRSGMGLVKSIEAATAAARGGGSQHTGFIFAGIWFFLGITDLVRIIQAEGAICPDVERFDSRVVCRSSATVNRSSSIKGLLNPPSTPLLTVSRRQL